MLQSADLLSLILDVEIENGLFSLRFGKGIFKFESDSLFLVDFVLPFLDRLFRRQIRCVAGKERENALQKLEVNRMIGIQIICVALGQREMH